METEGRTHPRQWTLVRKALPQVGLGNPGYSVGQLPVMDVSYPGRKGGDTERDNIHITDQGWEIMMATPRQLSKYIHWSL